MIDKYIKWGEIWRNEICLKTAINDFENRNDEISKEILETLKQFQNEDNIQLMTDECVYEPFTGRLIFFFGAGGGQNESDTQGWSREYIFIVVEDFMIFDAEYRQK